MRRFVATALLALAGAGVIAVIAYAAAQTNAAPPGRHTVPAPIDGIEVVIRESLPPQVTLIVRAGLPSGCAVRDSHMVRRTGDTFTVTVLNTMPDGDPICTMIYGTYELRIDLGTDFRPGGTYVVQVNDRTTTFRT